MTIEAVVVNFVVPLLLIFLLVLFQWYLSSQKQSVNGDVEANKLAQTKIIVYAGFAVIFLLYVSGVIVHRVNVGSNFLTNLSITIIISWLVLLVSYYAWALYFYNVGLGWSDDKWHRFRIDKEDPTAVPHARNKNPHDEETLGLPPGTVRGTIALTLLVGALALTIASFGMDSSVKSNTVMIDNFQFYKEAFLMMIAFYFGAKALEILQGNSGKPKTQEAAEETPPAVGAAKKVEDETVLRKSQTDFNDPNALG